MSKRYKDYYVIGFQDETVEGAVILDAFASTGNGARQLDEAKRIHFRAFRNIRLVKVVTP